MLKTYCSKIAKFVLILLVTPLFFVAYEANAQTSTTINFQGKIVRNDIGYEGLNVTTGSPACVLSGADTCDFQVKYYSASTAGTLYLTETFVNKEIGDYQGIFNLSLGSGSMTAGTYSNLDQMINGTNSIYVEILFSPAGNSTFTETFSRMPLQAAPFAIRSKYSEMAKGAFKFENAANSTGYTGSEGMVYYDTTDSTLKLYSGGTWTEIATGGSSIWQSASITSFSHSPSQFLETTGIMTKPNFGYDSSENRAWVHGASARTGFSVYSNYNGATDWPVASFKADAGNFTGSILELYQDGTGSILDGYTGSNMTFSFDSRGDLHLSSDGVMYFEPFATAPSGNLSPASGEGCLYNVAGSLYWDEACDYNGVELATGSSSLWTDGGTFTYLTSTTDDIYFGGNTLGTSTFVFDVDASGGNYLEIDNALNTQRLFTIDANGNVGIGTDTPTAKLDIGGTNSNIVNALGDITITPAQNLIISQGSVGIGTASPTSLFSVGSTSQFQVSTTGDIVKIKNLTYSWPSAHTTNGLLVNNGSGTLAWSTITALGGVTGTGSGTATAGQITFWNSSTSVTGDNGFWWDNANKRLGIGTNTPQSAIDIAGATSEIANTDGDITILPANNLIVSGGNLGINTTSVSKTLTVAGNMKMYFTNTGTSSTNIFDTTYTQSVAAPAGTIYGYYNKANYTATGTMLEMGAAKYDAQNDTTGTITRLYALDANVFNKTTGTVSTAAAIHARGFQEAYAGTISALHGVLIENAHKGSGGTITGQSGLTIAGLTTGTNNTHLLLGTTTIPSGNYAIYSASANGSYFAGGITATTFSGALSGNASTATTLIGDQGNWASYRTSAVANMLSWKNYGNGHVIFDASNSTSPTGSAVNNTNPGVAWTATYPTLMGWNGSNTYGIRVDRARYAELSSGNFGVGTSPSISLAIGDNDTGLNWISDGNFALYNNNVERIRFASNGKVGIGTTGPGPRLHVLAAWQEAGTGPANEGQMFVEGTSGSHAILQIKAPSSSQVSAIAYSNRTNNNLWQIGMRNTIDSPNYRFSFYYYNGSSFEERMYLNAGTNLGIVIHATANDVLAKSELQGKGAHRYALAIASTMFYEYYTDNSNVIRRNTRTGSTYDLAEWFPVGNASVINGVSTLTKGDIVCADVTAKEKVVACTSENQRIIGVVTTKPYTTMGENRIDYDYSKMIEIAVVGRIPTIVTSKNGDIRIGDSVTITDIKGVGAKALKSGEVVGTAVEDFVPSSMSCPNISSIDAIQWPSDEGRNEAKPCFRLPDGTYIGKIMLFLNISWYDPSTSATTETLTESGWYRISQLNGTDDYAKIKVNNSTLGSSQNLILSVDTVGDNNNVNVISNFTTGGYDINKARINEVDGIKYLEVYLGNVNSNSIKVSIEGDNTNWIATNIVKVEDGIGIVEYAFNGVLFGISDNFAVSEDGISTSGTLLTSGLTSDIGNSGNRWNDIYTKGTIRLGSGNSEGGIRYNIDKKRLEFSNDGINWVEMGDLASNMVISPEYSGAILYADGSDNNGRMTSDAISTNGVFKNYYEWISDKPTLQDYDILVRITLPSDFVSWKENAISLDFMTENSASTINNKVEMALMGDSGIDTEVKDGISKMPGAWERISIKATDITECKKAGDSCTLKLSMYSKENYYVRVGDISLSYNRGL